MKTPLFCPVCMQAMSDPNDPGQFHVHGCCDECAVNFAEVERERWAAGWRPTVDEARRGRQLPRNT